VAFERAATGGTTHTGAEAYLAAAESLRSVLATAAARTARSWDCRWCGGPVEAPRRTG
jgi:hypothetical protein